MDVCIILMILCVFLFRDFAIILEKILDIIEILNVYVLNNL